MESKIKSLVICKHLILKSIPDILFNEEEKDNQTALKEWTLNFQVLSEILNVDLQVKDLLHKQYHYDKIISSYLLSSIENDTLLEKISENFGDDIAILYFFLSFIIAIHFVCSIRQHIDTTEDIAKERRKLILSELEHGDQFIHSYFEYSFSDSLTLSKFLPPDVFNLLKKFETQKSNKEIDYNSMGKASFEIIDLLYPGYNETVYNLRKSHEFIERLSSCRPGYASWKKYENLSIEMLRYLLIPEFNTFFFQNRTEDGHQVRDAILPNVRYDGFWNSIRNEFSSKNIVVEFKNGIKRGRDKNALNQLRIYLSKKTIGRFGFLFVRNKPSASLLLARKLAYQESDILILIIDDTLLKKLLVCKALMSSCNELLQKEKVRFEIEF
jgi:hypothetical protein